ARAHPRRLQGRAEAPGPPRDLGVGDELERLLLLHEVRVAGVGPLGRRVERLSQCDRPTHRRYAPRSCAITRTTSRATSPTVTTLWNSSIGMVMPKWSSRSDTISKLCIESSRRSWIRCEVSLIGEDGF